MKIVRHPYHASIVPQPARQDALWHLVVREDGSEEILARHDARNKEDAQCLALLEISRLKRSANFPNPPLRNAS